MGIVRAIQKGEADPSDFNKDAQDAAKKMKKSSVKKYAKTKHKGLPTKKVSEGKLETLALNLLRNINKETGISKYDHTKTAHFNKVMKFLRSKMPKAPDRKLGDIAMSYGDYRKKQPKATIPDIDSVKDMEKTLKKLGMKEGVNEKRGTCWVGYKQVGMKDKGGRKVPNCVKEITEIYYEENGKGHGYTFEHIKDLSLTEAEYQGRKVKLGKIMQGDTKKFKVYVKNPKGNVVKVNFGHGGSSAKGKTMKIRKSNPKARKSFRARHNCDNPGPRHKARYWSCRKW